MGSPINILVYGDSNSHGSPPAPDMHNTPARLSKAARWPEVMAQNLGDTFDVINDSLPGRTTVLDDPRVGAYRNGKRHLPVALDSHAPLDLVIFMLGTNDLQYQFGARAYDIVRCLEKLAEITRQMQPDAKLLFISPPDVKECGSYAADFKGAEVRQAGLSNAIEVMTKRIGALFFDANLVIEVSEIDGVHFNTEMHQRLGEAVATKVKKWAT